MPAKCSRRPSSAGPAGGARACGRQQGGLRSGLWAARARACAPDGRALAGSPRHACASRAAGAALTRADDGEACLWQALEHALDQLDVLLLAEAADVEQQRPLGLPVGQLRAHLGVVRVERGREDVGVDALAPDLHIITAEVLELLLQLRRRRERQVGEVERDRQVPARRRQRASVGCEHACIRRYARSLQESVAASGSAPLRELDADAPEAPDGHVLLGIVGQVRVVRDDEGDVEQPRVHDRRHHEEAGSNAVDEVGPS